MNYEFGSSAYPKVSYVAFGGSTLDWLKSTGHSQLIYNLKKYGKGSSARPVAIVFNHGVNDLGNISQYISYMKTLEKELRPYNCKLFYVSINPINSATIAARNAIPRTEKQVLYFNAKIKSALSGSYKYIDTYSHLIKNGYVLDNNAYGYDSGVDDGIHYSANTSKRIFNLVINAVNKAK